MEYCDLGRGLSHLTTDPLDHLQDIADVDFEEICRERNCYLFPLFTVLFLVGFFGFLVCFFGKILSLHVICISFVNISSYFPCGATNCQQAVLSFFLSGIQKLVLAGRIGEAIETTQTLYPGLLERNPNLLFLLKCRQFVEMVSGCDSDVRPAAHSPRSSPNVSPSHSYSATSVGSVGSSSSSATNGFVTNGTCIDNGFEADNMPMEVEDFEESSSHGVLNGTAKMDESDHSPSRGDLPDFTRICFVGGRAGLWEGRPHRYIVSTRI